MLINEAFDALFMKVASREDIDTAMKFGVNYPKGLLDWADEIGLEKVLLQLTDLFEEFRLIFRFFFEVSYCFSSI